MNKSITARLREASAKFGAVCPLPVQDIHGALESIICLKDLTNQIKAGRLTDELGHDFHLNDAYLRAVELLAQIEGEDTKPKRRCASVELALLARFAPAPLVDMTVVQPAVILPGGTAR